MRRQPMSPPALSPAQATVASSRRIRPPLGRTPSSRALAVLMMPILAMACAGCDGGSSTTAPTDTSTTTTTVADASIVEVFNGSVAPGGSAFYSFSVTANGTVNLTLAAVGGAGVPTGVWLGIGLGSPNAEDCSASTTVNTQTGSTAQITGTYAPGVYCARVFDIGNLAAPAAFSLAIAHP